MFGGFRKRVTRQTIDMVRQPLAVFQHHHGLPPLFWQDEFVLGFFGSMIGLVSQVLGQGRLSHADKGYLLADCFSALSNMNGAAITRRFSDLATEQPHDISFKQGMDNGGIVTLALFGKTAPEDRAIVDQAERVASNLGIPVASYLMLSLFVEPLKERFELY